MSRPTEDERRLVDQLGDCWDAFLQLPVVHADARAEFRILIHRAQDMVLARTALRILDAESGNPEIRKSG